MKLSQMALQHSPPVEVPPDIQLLVAHVRTKGSCVKVAANPSREEGGVAMRPTMGLYVERDQCTHLVALGKVFEGASTIHSVPYGDDVVKVSVCLHAEIFLPRFSLPRWYNHHT